MQLQLDILPLLNWLDFCFKALLASCSMMCSPWKLRLYYKIDGDPSEISRTSTSKHSSLVPARCLHHWWWCVSLAHAQIVHVLIVLPSLLCTCLLPLFCLSTQSCSLAALICYCYLHACMQSSMVNNCIQCAWWAAITTEASAR